MEPRLILAYSRALENFFIMATQKIGRDLGIKEFSWTRIFAILHLR